MATKSVTLITNPAEHDAVVAKSEDKPTVLSLCNSVTPTCKTFAHQFEEIATRYGDSGISFCQMEFNNETSMMFKFAINQLPVVVFMCRGPWARSVVGATQRDVEAGIKGLLEQMGRGS